MHDVTFLIRFFDSSCQHPRVACGYICMDQLLWKHLVPQTTKVIVVSLTSTFNISLVFCHVFNLAFCCSFISNFNS